MIHLRQQIIDAREGDGTCRRVQPGRRHHANSRPVATGAGECEFLALTRADERSFELELYRDAFARSRTALASIVTFLESDEPRASLSNCVAI